MANTVKDLSGQRFGRLIALKPLEERKKGYVMWECKCDCGNTAIVSTKQLVTGGTLSCGCLRKERALEQTVDITGQRFGKLVELKPTDERRRGIVLWECQCDCGNIAYVLKTNLKKGATRSCGCLHRESANRNPVRDLTGQRFGRLVARKPMEERKNGYVLWECQCDCGNIAYVPTSLLTSGNTSSCGCLKKSWLSEKRPGKRPKDLTGQRFNKLVALRPTEERKNGNVMWECRCDCGNSTVIRRSMLVSGKTKSCGCLRKEGKKKN